MAGSKMVSRINSILAEKRISKQEFYDACGITSASYSLWNTGKTRPRMKNIEAIAKFLDVPVSHLLEDAEEKEKPTLQAESELDPVTQELFEIVNNSDEDELKALLEMARLIRKRRIE